MCIRDSFITVIVLKKQTKGEESIHTELSEQFKVLSSSHEWMMEILLWVQVTVVILWLKWWRRIKACLQDTIWRCNLSAQHNLYTIPEIMKDYRVQARPFNILYFEEVSCNRWSKCTWPDCVLCIAFICRSPNECWLHTCQKTVYWQPTPCNVG